jgi:hypothetical protein
MTAASDSGGIRMVPLAAHAPHPLNPRPGLGDRAELAASIAAQGMFELWSCPVPPRLMEVIKAAGIGFT